jgi:hypothetical protein
VKVRAIVDCELHFSHDHHPYWCYVVSVLAYKDEDMLSIQNNSPDVYNCDKFGIHKKIPILKEIYEDGKG